MAKSDDDTQRDNRKENDKIKSSDLEEETKLSRLFYLQLYSSVLNAEVGGTYVVLYYSVTSDMCAVACKSSCKCYYILLINSLARKQEEGESEEEKATDSRRQEEGGKVAFMDGSMVQPAVQINK